jgi:hypothetical protein|eukprot:78004_1
MFFSKRSQLIVICAALSSVGVAAFSPVSYKNSVSSTRVFSTEVKPAAAAADVEADADADAVVTAANSKVSVPLTLKDMVKQSSEAMEEAKLQGITRQTIRVLLPRDPKSADLGNMFEEEVEMEMQDILLAPPDESWQGGIMQLYRACAPTCKEILRNLGGDVGGVPPKLIEDRSVDDSGVDGVGLWMTQSNDPKDDISCFVQPLQETVSSIETISKQAGERLVVLMNPQWRSVDDALDSASREEGIFGSIASFLGGKGNSLRILEQAGFKEVYAIEGYVCKGGNVRLMKRFDTDWVVFAENDSETGFITLGEQATRPTYQDVEKMLDDKGVSLKYARDIGLAPKLE